MTAPSSLSQNVIDSYRTCEFTTLGRDGTPITWPTIAVRRPDDSIVLTTCISFPQKAFNIRRDPRVAMLFSDPTGSGVEGAPQVLVTGTATCPDGIVTTARGLEDYWAKVFERQPASGSYVSPALRRLMAWYYMRLIITVTPTSVLGLPRVDGIGPSPDPHRPLGADVIARTSTAVLGFRDATGNPFLVRTRACPTRDGYLVDVPPDLTAEPGPASLLVHRHDQKLSGMMNAAVTGTLSKTPEGRHLFVPRRVIEPSPMRTPLDPIRVVRQQWRSTTTYLERRNLRRPAVDWTSFRQIARTTAPSRPGDQP